MKKRQVLLAFVAAGMMSAVAQAAPILNMGIQLEDTAGVALPQPYILQPGQVFRVNIIAQLATPNQSDAGHDEEGTALPAIPLGIQALSFHLVSGGAGGLVPLSDGNAVQQHWSLTGAPGNLASRRFSPTSLGPSTGYNLIDQGADGDLDPSGVGYANTVLSYEASGQTAGISNGLGTQINVIRGGYMAGPAGAYTLTTQVTTANTFNDPAAPGNALEALTIAQVNNAGINIVVVPEPASLGLLSLAGLGLLGIRRRD